jgi:hypothetical protein
VLADLKKQGLIDQDMVCADGTERWMAYSVMFPPATVVAAKGKSFIKGLRDASHYQVARSMIRLTAAFAIVGLLFWFFGFEMQSDKEQNQLVVSGFLTLLQIFGLVGVAQLFQALLDGADALVQLAKKSAD